MAKKKNNRRNPSPDMRDRSAPAAPATSAPHATESPDHLKEIASAAKELVAAPPWYKRWWAIGLGVLTVLGSLSVIVSTVADRPTVRVSFTDLRPVSNNGPFLEVVVDVQRGRPAGIDDLRVSFDFPSPIHEATLVSAGACSEAAIEKERATVIHEGRRLETTKATLRAEKCAADTSVVLQVLLLPTPFDAPLRASTGSYTVDFNWSLPIAEKHIHWVAIDPFSQDSGSTPGRPPDRPYIPTRAYPAGIVPLRGTAPNRGGLVLCIDPRDVNDVRRTATSLYSFSNPSTRLRLSSNGAAGIAALVKRYGCPQPIEASRTVDGDLHDDPEQYRFAAAVQWEGCSASLDFFMVPRVPGTYDCDLSAIYAPAPAP